MNLELCWSVVLPELVDPKFEDGILTRVWVFVFEEGQFALWTSEFVIELRGQLKSKKRPCTLSLGTLDSSSFACD